MVAATATIIKRKSQDALVQYLRTCFTALNDQWNLRAQMQSIDRAYQREVDYTSEQAKAKTSNRLGDPTKFQNVIVPIVMPHVEAAVTYQTSVFLTGVPIFGWVAPPGQEDAALQFQAITEENAIRGGWTQQLMIFFRDCFKYNLGCIEKTWGRQVTAAIETDISAQVSYKQGKPKEVIWEGNILRRRDLYNTFWDTRYPPSQVYMYGEFAGYIELMSRIHLKKFMNELPDMMVANIKEAFAAGLGTTTFENAGVASYYIPQINGNVLSAVQKNMSFDWMNWAGVLERPQGEMLYNNLYEVTTLYARIIPQDFLLNVPSANTPQVWKFIFVNFQVLIYAERCTNAHGYIPMFFGQPYEDGLGYQTKSLAQNAQPFQEVGSALINSAIAARRRAISDRGIYNPLLVAAQHINNDSPTAKIPMRPAGYNRKPEEAYYAIPFRDEQSGLAFQELGQILNMAQTLNGLNPARQGQFVKGNKTTHEFDTVMANANGRDQTISILLENQVFTPIKEVMKIDTLQYQAGISLYSPSQNRQVKIDPVALRKSAVTFKITDGLNPADKVINGDDFTVALQSISTSQEINSQYNVAPMFTYLMKTRNVDLAPFEKSQEQAAYEQALQYWKVASDNVMELMKSISIKIEGLTPEKVQEMVKQMLPPQPTPQQYNYNPAQSSPARSSQTQPVNQNGNATQ